MGARRISFDEWLAEGRYLPEFMRSMRQADTLLAYLADAAKRDGVQPRLAQPPALTEAKAIAAFLLFMAREGYILQPLKKERVAAFGAAAFPGSVAAARAGLVQRVPRNG